MYKVLVVDDSALMRKVLCDIIDADSEFQVVDVSADGLDAYNKVLANSYDMVILDLILPKMTGLELIEKLSRERANVRVIAISSAVKEDVVSTVKAMEYGVFDFVVKPLYSTPESRLQFQGRVLKSMRAALPFRSGKSFAERVEARKKGLMAGREVFPTAGSAASETVVAPPKPLAGGEVRTKSLIALACSTGGPQALCAMIPMLPKNMGVPLVLVQHMPKGFTASLAERLDQLSQVHVKEAEDKELLKPGWVYIAPGGHHMEIHENRNKEAYVSLLDSPPVNSLRPCADLMYRSLENSSFDYIVCVVLTGMGSDGMIGIKGLSRKKKISVITESADSCIVYGMPRAVELAGMSDEVVPIKEVASTIMKKLGV